MQGSDTRHCSGDEIRAGDSVRCGPWTGRVAFVLGTGSFAAGFRSPTRAHLGRGFMVDYDKTGQKFAGRAGDRLTLVARA